MDYAVMSVIDAGKGNSVQGIDQKPVRPVRHYGRIAVGLATLVMAVVAILGLARNRNIDWGIVGQYLFNDNILRGLLTTLQMTVLAMALGMVLAVAVALMRLSSSRILQAVGAAYVFMLRGVPLVVQVIFWGNLGLFMDEVSIGIPFTSITFYSAPTAGLITPFIASVAALAMAESAFEAEIIRAGLLSVGRGQREAAKALGLSAAQTIRKIIVPQAMKVILPPTGNQLIGVLKATAIVSVIAGGDLLTQAENISGLNYRTIELLLVATIWYLTVVALLSVGQFFLERKVAER